MVSSNLFVAFLCRCSFLEVESSENGILAETLFDFQLCFLHPSLLVEPSPFLLLLLGTPAVTYYFQRRKFIEDDGFTEYAALWMLGIMLFILGTLLCSFIVFLVLQYCRPTFIYEQAQAAVDVYSKMPQMKDSELLGALQHAINEKILPTPIEMVMSVFWFVTFVGSLVSALTALLAQRPLPDRHKHRNN